MNTIHNPIPANEREALQWLMEAVDRPLQKMAHAPFIRAWNAVFFLYGGLHPDGCDDHGEQICHEHNGPERFQQIEPRLLAPYYLKSGWPVLLAPLAAEACARFGQGRMTEAEFYPVNAQFAGFGSRAGGDASLEAS